MLARTSDVLARNKIGSIKELGQRLYEQLGGATTADLLNHAVGEIFPDAYKAISFASLANDCTTQQVMAEERRVLFDGQGPIRKVPMHNLTYARYLSKLPAFVQIQGSKPIKLSKTLLGEMVGDIFAVGGICAGSDPVLEYSVSSALGYSANRNGLSTPLISLLMVEWAANERSDSSLAGFVRRSEMDEIENRDALDQRIAKAAKRLDGRGFAVYNWLDLRGKKLYTSTVRRLSLDDIPAGVGKHAVIAAKKAMKHGAISAQSLSEAMYYGLSHTRRAIYWLVENGYAEVSREPVNIRSELFGTKKSHRLRLYVEKPMELLGFYPGKNGPGSVRDAPELDVAGLVRYRENHIDPLCAGGALKDRFEYACKVAYQRHLEYAGRKTRTL